MKKTLFMTTALLLCAHAELFTEHFSNGVVKSQIEYKDGTRTDTKEGIKDGKEKIYYSTGELAYEVTNVNGKREGALNWYDRDGKHLEVIHYQKGKRHGINKLFYPNGKLRAEVMYINDKKEGPYKEYFDTGRLALEVNYRNDRKEGMQKEYYPNGKLYTEVLYKNGYKEGMQIWYDKEGKVIQTQKFKMDRPLDVIKKLRTKKPDATNELLKGLDFDPNKRKIE